MFKRLFDIFMALTLGFLCLPLTPVLALAVKLESSGPAIHPSLRVGKDGKLFHYFRLRMMAGNPPQKTALGKMVGNLSLDELLVAQDGAFKRQALVTCLYFPGNAQIFRGI